ncbi:MAG: carboxypeptidase-like regulatory domain-containing protein [archaeon]
MRIRLIIVSFFMLTAVSFQGCKTESRNITEPVDNPVRTLRAVGQLTGTVINRSTQKPVANAVVSISYDNKNNRTTTDEFGHYTFSNVPVTDYKLLNGRLVASGSYPVTLSMVELNKTQADSEKYRDYYYQTANILFTSVKPEGDSLAVDNMVADLNFDVAFLNTTVSGKVVDVNNTPAANAVVYLYDLGTFPNYLIAQTTTDNNGVFTFTKVENGATINLKAVSSDAQFEASLPNPKTLDSRITKYTLRPENSSERLELRSIDNHNPFVVAISPEYNADIQSSADFKIVYSFSEPIQQNQYTKSDVSRGLNTMRDDISFSFDGLKKVNGALAFDLAWDNTYTKLTITPKELLTSGKYTLDMRTVLSKLKDQSGKYLLENSKITGDLNESLRFSINQNLKTTAVPVVSAANILNYDGGNVTLSWGTYTDPNVSYFNVYKSTDGQPFQLLSSSTSLMYNDNTGSLLYPNSTNPLRAVSVKYKVKAVSRDLFEGEASNVIEIKDSRQPETAFDTLTVIAPAGVSADASGSVFTYIYNLAFSEPLSAAEAQKLENYTITGAAVSKVSAYYHVNSYGPGYIVDLAITSSSRIPATKYFYINCGGTIRDIAGHSLNINKCVFKVRGLN